MMISQTADGSGGDSDSLWPELEKSGATCVWSIPSDAVARDAVVAVCHLLCNPCTVYLSPKLAPWIPRVVGRGGGGRRVVVL